MTEIEPSALQAGFFAANANRQFIVGQMAEVIRNLMRAASSEQNNSRKSSDQMEFVVQLLEHCDEPLTWYDLFSDAIAEIRANLGDRLYDKEYIYLAERGVKYFVESSATDSGASGRASRRRNELQDSIRQIEAAKVDARKIPTRAQQVAWAEMDENAKNLGKLK